MTKQIRIGIVGTSGWTELLFLNAIPTHAQAEIVSICGRNSTRVDELARKYGIGNTFTDYNEMIASGKLDAVVVATPDDLHFPVTMAALDAGLHVLCEKPLAMNVAQAKAMTEKATEIGVQNMVLFTWRWPYPAQYMAQLLSQNYIGAPYHAEFRFITGFNRHNRYHWRLDPARSGGELADHGSHMFDLARFFLGEIKQVNAQLSSNIRHAGLEGGWMESANDTANCLLEFTSGAQATVALSSTAYLGDVEWEQTVTVYGENGTLQMQIQAGNPDKAFKLLSARPNENYQEISVPESFNKGLPSGPFIPVMLEMFATQSVGPRLFIDSILENKPISPGFYDGFKAQQIIDAAFMSHQTGCWVEIPK
jgi:predicted dehydrogenase